MSARIGRSRAAVAVVAFAVIAAAWASVQVGSSTADVPPVCPPTTADCAPVDNLQANAEVTADLAPSIAVGEANGAVADTQKQASSEVASEQSGYGPAGSPAVVGAGFGEGAATYEDATGQPFTQSTACNVLNTSGVVNTRAVAGGCDGYNRYACWNRVIDLDRHYTSGIYWAWQTSLSWCGYTTGKITSHSYNDHDAISYGLNCGGDGEQRTPVEKIDSGHWQEHSNFRFKCAAGAINHEDDATEGWHFYNNGYYKEIERGGG